MKKIQLWRGLAAVFIVLFAVMLIGTLLLHDYYGVVNNFLGIRTSGLVKTEGAPATDTAYFKSEFGDVNNFTADSLAKLKKAEDEFVETEAEEGSVLLMNNGALPLASDERNVTLLGHASYEPVYKPNSGGGSRDPARNVDFISAFTNKNFNVNRTLYDAYAARNVSRGASKNNTGVGDFSRAEAPASFYTPDLVGTFSEYNDAGIVILARMGGEDRDLPQNYEGMSNLALYDDERELIKLADRHFDKVIVLLNSANPMEISEFETLGVDACLWIAGSGITGFNGDVDLLTGAATPSGKLVDTYATDSLSAPAVVNSGDITFNNVEEIVRNTKDDQNTTTKYLVYQEGIYVGYKYYETRYEDLILNRFNAADKMGAGSYSSWNYAEQITYPFVYGLSYTTFDQKIVGGLTETDEGFEINVEVKNTGNKPGKSVVELYVQAPYIAGGVEKSAIQLLDFNKTVLLQPGEVDEVTVTADKYLFASYDHKVNKGYVLDKGDYYFALGNDAHDALNNILKAKGASGMYDHRGEAVAGDESKTKKWTNTALDTDSFKHSEYTNNIVTNRFDDIDINNWIPNAVKYLSRSDWQGTYPTAPVSLSATSDMIKKIDGYSYVKPDNAKKSTDYPMGVEKGINFIDMKEIGYDEELLWNDFLDQLTLDDYKVIIMEEMSNREIKSVNKPANVNSDGLDGLGGSYLTAGSDKGQGTCTAYANEVVSASSWNPEILKRRGELMGEDGLVSKTSQVWAPGANTHRTPFSGRNFEYYSEDPIMAYRCGAIQAKAMQSKGLTAAIKHFAGNDQETNRTGVSTFMTEQTWREVYLKAFEGAFTEGGALGTMTAFNRVGMEYFGANSETQIDVLRNEWGFKGVVITDAATATKYMQTVDSLVAGTDMFNAANVEKRWGILMNAIKSNDDGYLVGRMRFAAKNYFYSYLRSNLINGMDKNTIVKSITPWWVPVTIVLDCAFGAAALAFAGLTVYGAYFKKKREEV